MSRFVVVFSFIASATALAQSSIPPRAEEVRWVAGGDTVVGTFTFPERATRVPAVLLLSGAGADDRDASNGQFRPFRILADSLVAAGVAVLRYDDRGIGRSGGRHAWQYTVAEHQAEVRGALALLRARREVDVARIGLVGHSYGTVMATIAAASDSGISALVLLSPARGFLESQMDFQEAMARRRGRSAAEARSAAVFESTTVAPAIRTGEGWPAVRAAMRRRASAEYEELPDSVRVRYPTLDHFFATLVDSFTLWWAAPGHPFFKSYFAHDILETYRGVRSRSVLMLWGETDAQTPATTNRAALERAFATAGIRDVSAEVVPNADHYLRLRAPTDRFAPGVPSRIVNWLSAQLKREVPRPREKDPPNTGWN